MTDFTWDPDRRQYYNEDTGEWLSEDDVIAYREEARSKLEAEVLALAGSLASGDITVQEWERQMQLLILYALGADFLLGIGGVNAWNKLDRTLAGQAIDAQYEFLRSFAYDIAERKLTEKAIIARARMYVRAAAAEYQKARARAWGIDLPGYPGVGTICLSNCGCSWEFEADEESDGTQVVYATWVRGKDDSCATCLDRAAAWRRLRYVID